MTCDWIIACRRFENRDIGPTIVGVIRKVRLRAKELPRSITIALAARFAGNPTETAEVTLSVISPTSTVLSTERLPIGLPSEADFVIASINTTFTLSDFGRHTVHVMVRSGAETSQNLTYFDFAETTVH